MTTTYSPGWAAPVALGDGQAHVLARLRRSVRHPSRTWHDAPRMREFGRSPGTAHRAIARLRALGVIATQSALGRTGGVRFTLAVRAWRTAPVRADRRVLARVRGRRSPAPGQLPLTLPSTAGPPSVGTGGTAGPSLRDRLEAHGFRPWWAE